MAFRASAFFASASFDWSGAGTAAGACATCGVFRGSMITITRTAATAATGTIHIHHGRRGAVSTIFGVVAGAAGWTNPPSALTKVAISA